MAVILTFILCTLIKISQAQIACSSFTDTVSCTNTPSCTWAGPASGGSCGCASEVKLDILFGVDTSGSIGLSGFLIQKDFILGLVQQGISNSSRMGFYMFNTMVNKSRGIQFWDQASLTNYVNGLWWSAGWTNTGGLISEGLIEFERSYSPDRAQIFLIITDGNPCLPQSQGGCPQSACQYKTQIYQAGIRVVIIGVGDGLNSVYVKCLTQSDDDFIPVIGYDPDAFDQIMGSLSAVLCQVAIQLKVTEVKAEKKLSTWNSRLTRFVEIYNSGIDFTLDEIEISGLIVMAAGNGPNITVSQGEYVVFYDASDEPLGLSSVGSTPSCHLCEWDSMNNDEPCDLSGCADTSDTYTGYCFCGNALYVACGNSGDGVSNCNNNIGITGAEDACSTCIFNDAMDNSDWDITISNAGGSVIDTVDHGAANTGSWIVPVDGYSLELAWKGFDNDFGGNWIQSCYIYGTPGSDPLPQCPSNCVNIGSDCGGGNNYCDTTTGLCVCDTDYGYYPQCSNADTCLQCALLPEIDDCNVYFRKNGTERYAYFNWTNSIPLANEVFTLTYFDGSIDCGVDLQGNPIIGGGEDSECDVTTLNPVDLYNNFYRLDNYYALNTTFSGFVQTKIMNIDGNDYYSVPTWCNVFTMAPSNAPTASPTTAEPTTKSPTRGPLDPGVTRSPTFAPTTSDPTTSEPTTSSPTTVSPTFNPTTASPTTISPTRGPLDPGVTRAPSIDPTTMTPTTAEPTSAEPTSSSPTTVSPTSAPPTSADPTTAEPSTMNPTRGPLDPYQTRAPTGTPTTASPTTASPTRSPLEPGKTHSPTGEPTYEPSESPTSEPTTAEPTDNPTPVPTEEPTNDVQTDDASYSMIIIANMITMFVIYAMNL